MKKALKVWPQLSNYPGLTLKATISSIICAGYKILGEKKTHCINAWDFKQWTKDINNDYEVVKAIKEILEDADAVVTHNGKKFDWKYLQTRIMFHKLKPLHKIKHVDTREEAKKHLFAFNNKLNTIGELLANEKKLTHEGWDLWVKVCEDDKKSKKKMADYCKQDVNLLEKCFKELRPLITAIPNYNLFNAIDVNGQPQCPKCGSTRLLKNGLRPHLTSTNFYQRLRCKDCGGSSRTDKKGHLPRAF